METQNVKKEIEKYLDMLDSYHLHVVLGFVRRLTNSH